MAALADALLLQLGYNAALVAVAASILGVSAGATGALVFLRRRALISDAVAHATLPGITLAFLVMVAIGLDGRALPGLMVGAALSALAGLFAVDFLTRRTRLSEDAAIGAVLSVFFGFGVVLLTVIQSLAVGRQAGLEGFLLGATAGMLWQDAVTLAVAGGITLTLIVLFHRLLVLVAFDPGYAETIGVNVPRMDALLMGLVLAVTVIGLSLVGLVLIVALLIIPAVAARFWTDRAGLLTLLAGAFGGAAGYLGAAFSAAFPDLPTGPIVVLVAAAIFAVSFFAAPHRGVLAAVIRHRQFQARVHLRQGLLALARQELIYDPFTLQVLRREGLIRPDGVATEDGEAEAAKALLDERRWDQARRLHQSDRYDGLTPIEAVLTADEITAIDARLAKPHLVEG